MNQIFLDNKIPAYFDAWNTQGEFSKSLNGFPLGKLSDYLKANSNLVSLTIENIDGFLMPLTISDLDFDLFRRVENLENFFYPIGIHWWFSERIDTKDNIFDQCLEINQTVIKAVNSGRCKIILYNPFEGWEESFWKKVADLIIKKYNTLTIDDFIVISNNVNIIGMKSVVLLDNQLFDQSYSYFNSFEELHHYIIQNIVNKVPRPYRFVALMRRPRTTRWAIMTELFDDRDKGLMSFSIDLDATGIPLGSIEVLDDNYANSIRKNLLTLGSDANNMLVEFSQAYPNTYDKFLKNKLYKHIPFWILGDVNPKLNPKTDDVIFKFTDSYLHIVSETYFRNLQPNHLHFSEKIFKPIWYLQPFVLFGKCGSLYNLTRFGYKTFAQWIDETYDQIEDDTERFHAAVTAAKNFYLQPIDKLNNNMIEMLPTLQHNFETLKYNRENQTTMLLEKLSSFLKFV